MPSMNFLRPILFLSRQAPRLVLACVTGATATVHAQPSAFPEGAAALTSESLAALSGKKFVGTRADGKEWTMEFGPDGYYKLSAQGGGGILDGKVRMDGTKMCQDMRVALESSCNEVRSKDNQFFYRRNSNGEVVTLTTR